MSSDDYAAYRAMRREAYPSMFDIMAEAKRPVPPRPADEETPALACRTLNSISRRVMANYRHRWHGR